MSHGQRIAYEGWEHGYVRSGDRGNVFYIRETIAGKTREVSTGAADLDDAVLEYREFKTAQKNGVDYVPREQREADAGNQNRPIHLTEELRRDYLKNCKDDNGRDWWERKSAYLVTWETRLAGKNLRGLPLRNITVHNPTRQEKATVKALYSFLRQRGDIKAHEDPTYGGALKLPKVKPAQDNHTKVIPKEDWKKVRAWLVANPCRSQGRRPRVATALAMDVLMGTGWHVRAVARFAEAGTFRAVAKPTKKVAGIIITPLEKHGRPQSNQVSRRVLKSAHQLRALGLTGWVGANASRAPELAACETICRDVKAARDATGVEFFGAGWHRHTVSTEAYEVVGSHGVVAAAIGNSEAMQRTTYASLGVAPKLPTRI